MNYPDQIADFCQVVVPVGSRVTCNPPPMDTDQDLLCFLTEDDYGDFSTWLEAKGWEWEEEYRLQGDFVSYRKDHWNIIATCNEDFFDKFIDATKACKAKNLLNKKDRIAEFDRVFGKKQKREFVIMDDLFTPQPGMDLGGPDIANYQHVVYGHNAAALGNPWAIQQIINVVAPNA